MITKEQAETLKYRDEVYYATPTAGKKQAAKHITCRVNGGITPGPDQTFRVPVKIGFNGYGAVSDYNNWNFHIPGTCPCRECAK